MQNPWLHLHKKPPYILECDELEFHKFNDKARPNYQLKHEYFPEPFLGDTNNAKVYLLNKNPGIDPLNKIYHTNIKYLNLAYKNLRQQSQNFPFFLLDPNLYQSPGAIWWHKKLKQLIKDTSANKVARAIACIELHGYPSKNYKHLSTLQSMQYSKYLVEQAIDKKALIVLMRGFSCWYDLVPNLNIYEHKIHITNVQNPCITPNNFCCSKYYQQILNLI